MHSYWYIQDIQALQHDTKTKTMLFPKRIKPVKELFLLTQVSFTLIIRKLFVTIGTFHPLLFAEK